jgi:L-iditol 2-dehydrogenase
MTASGAPEAQELAMRLVDKCGCVNFFGGLPHGSAPVAIDTNDIHYRHIRVVGTHGSTPEQNDESLAMIADGRVDVSDLVTARIGLDALEDALQLRHAGGRGLKTAVQFE